jgi:hypothetical protein
MYLDVMVGLRYILNSRVFATRLIFVKNTHAALEKLKDLTITDDVQMVYFDVTALFPNLPVETALILLKKWLKLHVLSMNIINSYVELAELCMKDNYFQMAILQTKLRDLPFLVNLLWQILKQNYQN